MNDVEKSSNEEPKESGLGIKKKILILGVFLLLVFAIFKNINSFNNSSELSNADTTSVTEEVNAIPDSVTLKDDIVNRISSTDSEVFKSDSFRGSIEAIRLELDLFDEYSKLIKSGLESESKDNQELASKLKKRVVKLQQAEFPKMRKEWVSIAGSKLWENNIYVTLASNKIVNLSGGLFASNKNIKTTQEEMSELLTSLRFKEVRYRWYKESDEFTYYKLESKTDTEI